MTAARAAIPLPFRAVGLPPASAFWSVAMYVSKSQLLVDNTCNRYLINAPMLDQLKRNLDGSITLLIQHASLAAEKVSNWLPAPNGPMSIEMRAYWPRTEPPSILPVGKGAWRPPALQPA